VHDFLLWHDVGKDRVLVAVVFLICCCRRRRTATAAAIATIGIFVVEAPAACSVDRLVNLAGLCAVAGT
jgi:hypothetical protein